MNVWTRLRALTAGSDRRGDARRSVDDGDADPEQAGSRILRPRRSLFARGRSDASDGGDAADVGPDSAREAEQSDATRRRPRFESDRGAYGDGDGGNGDEEGRPSTSGRGRGGERFSGRGRGGDRNWERRSDGRPSFRGRDDGDRYGERRSGGGDGGGGYRQRREYGGSDEADGRQQRRRFDTDGEDEDRGPDDRRRGDGGGRGGRLERGGGPRDRDRDAELRREYGRGGRGGNGGGRGRGRDGGDVRGERRDDGPRGRRGEVPADADTAADAADAAAAGAEAGPVAGVPRPPGSSTGNRPLPYDLPIVRPYDGDKGTFFAGSGWRQVGASEEVVAALRTLGIARPSHIQALTFPALLRPAGRSASAVALADQAGSGKTLAYLLPLLQMLREEEAAAGSRVTRPKRPRGIVVAPTVELVQQVLRVARAVSGAGLKFRSAAFTGGQADEKARAASLRTQRELLAEGVDLLVATPGRLQQHLAAGSLMLDDCRALVLDEVDVLMGARTDFLAQVEPLRAAAPPSLRFVLVSATLPQHVVAELRTLWPDLQPLFGPGLHRTAAGLVEELVDCSGGDEVSEDSGRKRKLEALQQLLERHRAPRTIVFCNKIDSCRDVENFLKRTDPKEAKYRVLPYHEAVRDELRAQYLTDFLRPVARGDKGRARAAKETQPAQQPQQDGGEAPAAAEGPAAQPALVLVATDRTSRGIDAPDCEHVVLFDFPRDPSEYVRRVGRTARGAGGRGTVSSLVLGRQVPLAREIIERNQKGMPVHSLPE
ncbi:hypothetical protein GPECTOR_43g959 [Gonium pectorale]|uniref:Uncharacterized protein n=1 Tax=Gonium pectorale TaxID=33097 RepID=A0A150G9K5_GONPE|nr:hypothetical protein GPECTOR_43g959 [Gonium pectorale]|eukprot:KXZ46522.1 hypothetical protein GPECTOR_43g959 [Gonium pectorale]